MSTPTDQFTQTIESAQKIALFGHTHPDGDCIGACLATMQLLSKLDKQVDCFVPDSPAPLFSFLPDIAKIHTEFSYDDTYDLCIFLDCADPTRAGSLRTDRPEYFADRTVLVIDHHQGNPRFGTVNIIDDTASSTCEMLTEIFDADYHDLIDTQLATALLMGVSTDTGNFAYENDTERTFAAALKLAKLGAQKELIMEKIYRTKKLATIKFLGTLIERIVKTDGIIYSWLTDTELSEDKVDKEVADQFLSFFIAIQHDGVFLLFKKVEQEGDPHLRCSRRTKNPDLDVAELARHFGGGGHKRAAGMRVELNGDSYEETIKKTVKKISGLIAKQHT